MKVSRILHHCSYLITAAFLILFEGIHISKGLWGWDFWEHSAVVNELSRHFFHPSNPILNIDTPHIFFSPYALIVATFSKITGLSSIQSLTCFAFFNLLFFLATFYLFIKSIFRENHHLIASLGLLFILFFWGFDPYSWSGFYHIFVLNYVLPYPSTFALSLTFLTLSFLINDRIRHQYIKASVIIILSAVVFLSHAPTAVFLFVGIFASPFLYGRFPLKQCITQSAIHIIPCLAICLFWPYFNVTGLLTSNVGGFNDACQLLYFGVFAKTWPFLLIIPGLFYFKKDRIAIFLYAFITLTLLCYAGGYIFKFYGLSRLLSGSMMLSHILLAYMVIQLARKFKLFSKIYLSALIVSIVVSLFVNGPLLNYTFNVSKASSIEYYIKYDFLRNTVAPDDLILSDANSNWLIPSFSGKVVSSIHPLYGVKDLIERLNDVTAFFDKDNPDSLRQAILQKYKPDYVLINEATINFTDSTRQWLESHGQTIYNKDSLELIKVRKYYQAGKRYN